MKISAYEMIDRHISGFQAYSAEIRFLRGAAYRLYAFIVSAFAYFMQLYLDGAAEAEISAALEKYKDEFDIAPAIRAFDGLKYFETHCSEYTKKMHVENAAYFLALAARDVIADEAIILYAKTLDTEDYLEFARKLSRGDVPLLTWFGYSMSCEEFTELANKAAARHELADGYEK